MKKNEVENPIGPDASKDTFRVTDVGSVVLSSLPPSHEAMRVMLI